MLPSLLAELEASGALLEGHFRLSSGLHSNRYIQCAKLLEEPGRAQRVGHALADKLRAFEPESVLAPALGGVVIGYETAAALGVPFRFCERKGEEMLLRRGFALREGERVVVVEDVVTTGGSARQAGRVATESGAEVVGYGAIIDRGANAFGAPLVSLLELAVEASEASECALCVSGVPLAVPGSRPDRHPM